MAYIYPGSRVGPAGLLYMYIWFRVILEGRSGSLVGLAGGLYIQDPEWALTAAYICRVQGHVGGL